MRPSMIYPNLFHWELVARRHCDPNADEFLVLRMFLNTGGADTLYLGLSRRYIEFYSGAIW
jgi:hypothetical protein